MQIQNSEIGVLALPSGENVWREAWRQKDMDPSGNQKQAAAELFIVCYLKDLPFNPLNMFYSQILRVSSKLKDTFSE